MTLQELEAQVKGDRPQRAGQLERARKVLKEHPEAVLIECADEYTGRRFGRAKKRAGQCIKLGNTAWSPHTRCAPYQLWASWSPSDCRTHQPR